MRTLSPRARAGLALLVAPLLLPGTARATAVTRTFTSRGESVFTVPTGVSTVNLTVTGERGKTGDPGGDGGYGARVFGALAVTPGEKLYLDVGVGGGKAGDGFFASGDGGGASSVQVCPADGSFCAQAPGLDPLFSRLLIAGGGGGGGAGIPGSVYGASGGDASLPGGSGAPGQNGGSGTGGAGATIGAGGVGGTSAVGAGGDGARGRGGDGETLHGSSYRIGGAGGGGGLFGGGGSAFVWEAAGAPVAGGGGGESWARSTTLTEAPGIATTISNVIGVYALDTAAPSIQVVYDDTVAPQPTISTPFAAQQMGERPTFSGTASTGLGDAHAVSVTVELPGGSQSIDAPVDGAGTWSLTWPTALPAGDHTVTVSQDDDAGHTGTTPSRAFTVDTAAPAVALQQPAAGAVLATSTPTFSGLAGTKQKDLIDIGVDVYAGATASGTPVQSRTTARRLDGTFSIGVATPLPDGVYTVVARQADDGQHVGTSTRTFQVATALPAPPAPATSAPLASGDSGVGGQSGLIVDVAPVPGSSPLVLGITRVTVAKARRGCARRTARIAVTGRMRACRVRATIRGTIGASASGKRLTISASRRGARTAMASTTVRGARWTVRLTLPATAGKWTLAATIPGASVVVPAKASRLVVKPRR